MAQKLYSKTLQAYNTNIENRDLLDSLIGLRQFLKIKKLNILKWDDTSIAIPLSISVDLPPLGNFEGIDVKKKEPVIIVINLTHYPQIAPRVYPDRLDFPKDKLAHLYVAKDGQPPAMCIVRGDRNEWYSNKQLKDLVIRVSNWFRDASTGMLTEDGNQFDPLRLEGYSGTIIYDYDLLANIVNEKKGFWQNSNVAIGFFERIKDDLAYKFVYIVTPENISKAAEQVKEANEVDASASNKKHYYFGYIVWSESNDVHNNYSINLPQDWNTFQSFCSNYLIEIDDLEKLLTEYDKNIYINFPVIVGIKRPRNIIGFSSNIEFINFKFTLNSTDCENSKIINNIPVNFQKHSQTLTFRKAAEISGTSFNIHSITLIAGCGALGSKIIMHFARGGYQKFFIADPDDLSPHNLVRHALTAKSEGLNKAKALKQEIDDIFRSESSSGVNAIEGNADFFFKLVNIPIKTIFDFTASNAFLHSLTKATLSEDTKVWRGYLSDFGNLGILLLEGKNRNPRADDLQIILYSLYKDEPWVSDWLMRENKTANSEINIQIGVGCNSETIQLADDVVSLHASVFAGIIKEESKNLKPKHGKIFTNQILNHPFYHNIPSAFEIPALTVLEAINDSEWEIRIMPGIIELMKEQMTLALPRETGGVMIGTANHKTKTIHVVNLVQAPSDSESNPICFYRGIKGLPESIKNINEYSGYQLGYIGEWHTHPQGPESMSTTDMNSVQLFKKEFSQLPSPLPVFLMILTQDKILPFVY
ncbi:ThiF family adenylyltransferase [Flavobacterium psychrophilum]|nr:ThiF family adenylyltransferase [Flavobacterium psychrophilum]